MEGVGEDSVGARGGGRGGRVEVVRMSSLMMLYIE